MHRDEALHDTHDAETGAPASGLAVTAAAAVPGLSRPGAHGELEVDAVGQRAMLAKVAARLFGDDAEPETTYIGRFEVERRLGAGGMGVVYLARDPELDRAVAIKHLHPRLATGAELEVAERRMRREARAMARLAHPHVVNIHEVGTHDGQLFLAMEYVDGLTLADWLLTGERSWREILEVFCEAGEGLDEAHRVGLVHRDFKPENVLIGRGRAVKVTDFGLASVMSGEAAELTSTLETEPGAGTDGDSLGGSMTRTGAMLGTPLYMSPEQFAGEPTDARSDQFSFCVALYEALVGVRPFVGETMGELARAVLGGRLRPRPRVVEAPARVLAAVERGLLVEPDARWPSMGALLLELRRDPVPGRRRRVALASVALALAGVGAGAAWSARARAQKIAGCERAGASIEALWSPEVRAQLKASFEGTGLSFAATTAARALPLLDEFVSSWRQVRTDTCVQAEVEGGWAPELTEAADACLEERREQLASFVEALSSLGRDDGPGEAERRSLVRGAALAANKLPEVERCADTLWLRARPRPPDDARARAEVRRLRRALARASTLTNLARYDEASAVIEPALRDAEALGWAPLLASAHHRAGTLLVEEGRYAEAEAAHERAYFIAGEAGEDELAARAATSLTMVTGSSLARAEDGLRWSRAARMMHGRVVAEDGGAFETHILNNVAMIHIEQERYDEALEELDRARALAASLYGAEHPTTAVTLSNIGLVHANRGEFERSRELDEQVIKIREVTQGEDHPDLVLPLTNLGNMYATQGRFEEALTHFNRARELAERALRPGHPQVAHLLTSLGAIHGIMGDREEGVRALERAVELAAAATSEDHPSVAHPLTNLGHMYLQMHQLDAGRERLERAVEILERANGPEHADVAQPLIGLAATHHELGDYARALEMFTRALALLEGVMGAEHPDLGGPLTGMGKAALALGRREEAITSLRRALRLREAGDPVALAETRVSLARALGPEVEEASALAQQAHAALSESGGPPELVAEVDAWLKEHVAAEG